MRGNAMSKTLRVAIIAAVLAGLLVYTLAGSEIHGGEVMIKLNFWSLISLPVIAILGYLWVRKARR